MARMLEALKQLDARLPHVPEVARSDSPENAEEAVLAATVAPGRVEESVEAEPIAAEPAPSQDVLLPGEVGNRDRRELAENVLARLPADGRGLLAFTSAENEPTPGGLLRSVAGLLAERTEGGVLFVERGGSEAQESSGEFSGKSWADVYSGKVDWQTLVRETDVPGLSVLVDAGRSSGPQTPPAEWDPIEFVKTLRRTYAMVLFDVVPLAELRGAPWIGCCDGIYLLVRLHHTPQRAARRAAHAIRKRCGRFLGCIVVD